ncbi:hypothetical protein ACTMU2_15150 [Cupriavidus basilensis]
MADGATLLMASFSDHTIAPSLYPKIAYVPNAISRPSCWSAPPPPAHLPQGAAGADPGRRDPAPQEENPGSSWSASGIS